MKMLDAARRWTAVGVLALLLSLVTAVPSRAEELEFAASIISRDGNTLLAKTSGNETLRFDLSWYDNVDGYAFRPDEQYCFVIEQPLNGKLMVVSAETCTEPQPKQRRERERDRQPT